MTIRFGTEGWRGIMGEEFTVKNVQRVTQAVAEHVLATHRARRPLWMAVGYDTRFLSEHFARSVCEVLVGNGIRTVLTKEAIPTCAVSRYVRTKRLPAGIMITASHNPSVYNGLKVKEAYGGSATAKTVASIERRLGHGRVRCVRFEDAQQAGRIARATMVPAYLLGVRSFVDLGTIRRARLRVVVDPMYGVADRMIERLLHGGRCRVETIHAEADPLFGGRPPEPIEMHLGALQRAVRRERADIGIANDGDADRLGIIGPGGRWLNPGQVMCILLMHLVRTRSAKGMVIKTVSNTMMINRMTEALGLRLVEVPVGFKHIAKLMLEEEILIGGEESGGIGVQGYLPERDGIVNGLLLLEAMAMQRKKLPVMMRDLERRYGRWYYGRRDLHIRRSHVDGLFKRLRNGPPSRMAGIPVAQVNSLDGVKLIGRDQSWLLFRRSGTEPIVRIYAETPERRHLPRLLALGVRWARASS